MSLTMTKLDVFIEGENIDLCVPTREFSLNSKWFSWFNNPKITRFLDQGAFPNTPSKQLEFFELQEKQKDRLLLVISNKKRYLGVISLSSINLSKREAGLAIVVNSSLDPKYTPLIPLEAAARITEHGLTIMGLNRIYGGMHYKLSNWQQRLELIGYRVEGIKRDGFTKGNEITDAIFIAITRKVYEQICLKRGKYWDSSRKMENRIKRLVKNKFVDDLDSFFKTKGVSYYNKLINL